MTTEPSGREAVLEPCPFCGGSAVRTDIDETVGATEEDENYGGSFIECDHCGACTRVHFDRKENLFDAWNRRATPSPLLGNRSGLSGNHIDAVRAGADAPRDAWAWLSERHNLSLSWHGPVYGDDDDDAEEWRVYRESGGINDREWETVGVGATALDAVLAARRLLAADAAPLAAGPEDSSSGNDLGHGSTVVVAEPWPTPPWPAGAASNAKCAGWNAFYQGKSQDRSPFPSSRHDLRADYAEGWSSASRQFDGDCEAAWWAEFARVMDPAPAADGTASQSEPKASAGNLTTDEPSPSIPTQEWGELEALLAPTECRVWDEEALNYVWKTQPPATVSISSSDLSHLLSERSALEERVRVVTEERDASRLAFTRRMAEVVRVVEPLARMAQHIQTDVASAHSNRGNGASQWMREDDNEFRRDLMAAFEALAQLSTSLSETEEGEG